MLKLTLSVPKMSTETAFAGPLVTTEKMVPSRKNILFIRPS